MGFQCICRTDRYYYYPFNKFNGVDNSVDANASEIHVHATPNNDGIRFIDDGTGMDRPTFEKMLSLGYCSKTQDKVGK